jgi:Caspase domain
VPSKAVIIGGADFQQLHDPLTPYSSFGVSANELYGTFDTLAPFDGNCILVPARGGRVDKGEAEDAINRAAKEAKGAGDTLLVVYVGHGKAWPDHHDNMLHLAMYESRENRPSSWLEYSAIRYAMSPKKDGLRIFIADCCHSNVLHSMGTDTDNVPEGTFALMEQDQGTAIFTAVAPKGANVNASPYGCKEVDERWEGCTHFSSHLLHVLNKGSEHAQDILSLGDVRDEIRASMSRCPQKLRSGLILLGPADSTPFVKNRLSSEIPRKLPERTSKDQWVAALATGRQWPIEPLLEDPHLAAKVSLALWKVQEGRQNAHRIDAYAIKAYANDMDDYLAYWQIRDEVDPH